MGQVNFPPTGFLMLSFARQGLQVTYLGQKLSFCTSELAAEGTGLKVTSTVGQREYGRAMKLFLSIWMGHFR